MNYEQILIENILGHTPPSILKSDGYKFAMAQAGFPMREEAFYMSFRREGNYFVPFDIETVIHGLLAKKLDPNEDMYLKEFGYELTPGMKAAVELMALDSSITIHAAPKGSWVREKESFFTLVCPSFPCSLLEPLALMLHFPIQVATDTLLEDRKVFKCTCEDEANIVRATLEAIGKLDGTRIITVEQEQYEKDVATRAQSLIDALDDKDPSRLFEVGMRACSCMQMHETALEQCIKLGITSTSNVYMAVIHGIKAVGTTGHEHIMRWGNDLAACRAMRDMRPGTPSCLPDTFSVMELGLPAAFEIMRETPNRPFFIRFDSGDQDEQLELCVKETADLSNVSYIFEDSINDKKTRHFEALCDKYNIPMERRLYGAGGFFVRPEFTNLTRDRVSAVYKLCYSVDPVMKTCESAPTKASVPGIPVTFRRVVETVAPELDEFSDLIGQADEIPPEGFALIESGVMKFEKAVGFSPLTRTFQALCIMKIEKMKKMA